MNTLSKMMATGQVKKYIAAEDSFVAFGTRFVGRYEMYYTAANEELLWLCAHMGDNKPLPIGMIELRHLTRIVIDNERGVAYFELDNFEEVMTEADASFRMYRKVFTHTMSDNGAKALSISLELLSGNILPFLSERVPTEIRAEKIGDEEKRRGVFVNILWGIVIALFLFGIVAKFFG